MFAYCRNNPIARSDAAGTDEEKWDLVDNDGAPGIDLNKFGKGAGGGVGGRTTLYRSVSQSEANSIATTQKFSTTNTSMACKQFSFSFQEAAEFGRWANQKTIVSVDVPSRILNKFWTTTVDAAIFKHGTVTVYSELLPILNESMTNLQFYTISN